MSAWPGKFVIGLTGNIATGKSVVRKMLEHLGAYGIDADSLANRAIAKGSPGYQPIVETFGSWVLGADGQIDRARLGKMVFADAEALARLEAIVHPHVREAIDILVRRSSHKVIVVEAIKLLESGLAELCDSIWVTYAPPQHQLARLTQKRKMSETQALQRMKAQSPQEKKIARANVVIRNEGSYENTWSQVMAAWYRQVPAPEEEEEEIVETVETVEGEVAIQRARPREARELAEIIFRFSQGKRRPTREDIMAAFGEKAFLLLKIDGKALGMVGWKVENLVARTDEIFIDSSLFFPDAIRLLMNEVERVSRELQCEISLLFLPKDLDSQESALISLGYQRRSIESLGVRAWEEAAVESMPSGSLMLFKQLRKDRVLRPV
ncbi:MAG: dephospho-CoA kinase [Anaerolineales bacterium]|nr:dephospho-CoA kinase [Anaerolineales bacterium]